MSKRVVTKTEKQVKTTTKVVREPGQRVEERIVIQRKVNPYIDNYSYVETKNIHNTNPRFQVIVEHIRKGEIYGGEGSEQTSYQKQVVTQSTRQKAPEQNQKLKATKTEVKTTQRTTTTTRQKNPVSASATKEKVTETTMKRRNEGTGTKTETKTASKTTTTGIRGQGTTSSTSTKTTTKTTKIGGEETGSSTRKRSEKK
jgi:hypothetical protein